MQRLVIPGGSYAECFPDGTARVLVGKDVQEWHRDSAVALRTFTNPFRAPLQMRFDGVRQFAGQEADSAPGLTDGGAVIHFDGALWIKEGTTCGVNACAFAPDGTLHVNDHCQHGTQGIRWIESDGTIVTGDQTYDGRGTTGVAEWTRRGNVVVGQSYVSGCTITIDGDIPHSLEAGHCTFVRTNRAGDRFAVALWKQLENCAVLFWFTIWEIAGLPAEPTVIDPPPPPPPPPLNMKLTPAQFESLKAARAALGKDILTREEGGAYLNRWCWDHRHDPNRPGLELDESDPKAIMPNGTPIWAGLRIIVDGEHYGGDVSGAASVGQFTPVDAVFERANATGPHGRVEPIDPGGIIIDPPPPPPDVVSPAVKAYVMDVEFRLAQAILGVQQTAAQEVHALQDRVTILEGHPQSGFDPTRYKTRTRVSFLGTFDGSIEPR